MTLHPRLAAAALVVAACAAQAQPALPSSWVAGLEAELAQIDAQSRARIGVYVRDLDTGATASLRAGQRWYIASMVKVPVAIAVLRGIERGQFSLDTAVTLRAADIVDGAGPTSGYPVGTPLTIRFLLEQMIVLSDNAATDVLLDLVGAAEVNGLVESLVPRGFWRITSLAESRRLIYGYLTPNAERLRGQDLLLLHRERSDAERLQLLARLVDTPVARYRLSSLDAAYDAYYASGLNSARLDAYGELLVQLADGRALSPRYTAWLLDLMERVATGPHRLKAGLPDGTRFAHKTGTQRRRACDAGLVRHVLAGVERRVVIVACTRDERVLERSETALMQVGAAVCRSGALTEGSTDAVTCRTAPTAERLPAAAER